MNIGSKRRREWRYHQYLRTARTPSRELVTNGNDINRGNELGFFTSTRPQFYVRRIRMPYTDATRGGHS